MDLCKYAYYDANEKYCPNLYCNRDNKRCIYSKKCLKMVFVWQYLGTLFV